MAVPRQVNPCRRLPEPIVFKRLVMKDKADLVSRLRHHADVGMFVTDSCAKLLREAADAIDDLELKLDVERDLSQADRP